MLFNSVEFLFFLPVVFAIYWLIGRRSGHLRLQNLFIIAASYLFYGWWDVRFLLLIAFATGVSFGCGLWLEATSDPTVRRRICALNIIVALALLAIFKYFNFFAGNFSRLISMFGLEATPLTLQLVLPVGISFYTFQTLSYTIDVYRRDIRATRDAVAYFAFISFFPQLVAGPIERARNLLPQFLKERRFCYSEAVDGLRMILWGLFKKVVVADNCGVVVDRVFADWSSMGSLNLAVGAVFFAFQIYGDFSGYTDIAIGTAKLFGVTLRQNFRMPYFSRDIVEFWRRWHISLTSWFRDYLYIPMGGNRRGMRRTVLYTIVVFVLSGLWHGANWTFVAWGAFNALLFIPLIVTGTSNRHRGTTVADGRMLPSVGETLLMAVTFILVVIGWVIYRAESLGDAAGYMARMVGAHPTTLSVAPKATVIYIILMLAVEWIYRHRRHGFDIQGRGALRIAPLRWTLYFILTMLILMQTHQAETFIYFQF